MSTDPITGVYTSPFSLQGAGLPQFYDGPRHMDNPPGTRLGRAVGRGMMMGRANVGSTVEGLGTVLDREGMRDYGADVVARNQAQYARSKAVEQDSTLGMLADILGENIPQLAVSAGLPLVGAAVGSLAGPAGTAAGLGVGAAAARAGQISRVATLGLSAGRGARQGLAAGTVASAGFNYAMLAGEARETQKDELERQGLPPVVNEAAAFAAAVPATALETMGGLIQGRMALRAARTARGEGQGFFSRRTAADVGRTAGRGAVVEGATEVGQQGILRFQANQDMASEEAMQEYAMAGFAGAFLGGTLGGAGGIIGAMRRSQRPAEVTPQEMGDAVDRAIAPPLRSPQAEQDIQTEALAPMQQTPRPFEQATIPDMVADLRDIEQRVVSGQEVAGDADNMRQLRAELTLRDQAAQPEPQAAVEAPTPEAPYRPLQSAPVKDLNAALRQINKKAEAEALDPGEVQMRDVIQAELDARKATPAADTRQGTLLADMDPQVQATKDLAASMGLGRGTAFYRNLEARSEAELIDTVLDTVERMADGDVRKGDSAVVNALMGKEGELGLAKAIGVDRNFDGEIAAAIAARDKIGTRKGKPRELTPQDAIKFQTAQKKVAELEARKTAYDAGLQRLEMRKAAKAAQEAQALAAQEAAVAQEAQAAQEAARAVQEAQAAQVQAQELQAAQTALVDVQRRQREEAERAQAAAEAQVTQRRVAEAAGDQTNRPMEAPLTPLQRRLEAEAREAQARVTRAQEFAGAEQQRRDRDRLAARAAIADQATQESADPTTFAEPGSPEARAQAEIARQDARAQAEQAFVAKVTKVAQRGSTTELTMSRGDPVRLDKRKRGYFLGNEFMGRTLDTAKRAVEIRANPDNPGAFRAMMSLGQKFMVARDATNPTSQGHLAAVKAAIAKATKGWTSAVDIVVVQSASDLPDGVRTEGGVASALREGYLIKGVHREDLSAVFIIADAHDTPREAVATMFHEVLGHHGLRAAYGRDRVALLMEMYENSPMLQEWLQVWQAARGATYAEQPLHVQIEESIAHMAEQGPLKTTFLQRMKALLVKYARMVGMKLQLTDAEVIAMVSHAHEAAMRPDSIERSIEMNFIGAMVQSTPREVTATPAQMTAAAKDYGNVGVSRDMLSTVVRAASGVPPTPQGDQTIIQRAFRLADGALQRLTQKNGSDIFETIRSGAVYFQSTGHLVTQYGKLFPKMVREGFDGNALRYYQYGRDRRVAGREVYARWEHLFYNQITALAEAAQADTRLLMAATAAQIDPYKRLEDHTHLSPAERAARRDVYNAAVAAKNRLAKHGNLKAYDTARATMRATYMQQLALDLHDIVVTSPDLRQMIPSAKVHPVLKFLDNPRLHNDPAASEKFWREELGALVRDSQSFIGGQNRPVARPDDAMRIETLVSTLQAQLGKIDVESKAMDNYPYFHMGRFGNYYATFKMPSKMVGSRRVTDQRASESVAEELHNLGFDNVMMTETGEGATVYIRTDTMSQAESIYQMALRLGQTGVVDMSTPPARDQVKPLQELPESARKTLQVLMAELEANNAPTTADDTAMRKSKHDYVNRVRADMQAALLSRLPDLSTAKVMARRKFRSGYDKDFVRSYALRMQVAANSAAERLASSITNDAIREMSSAARDAREGSPDKWAMNTILREVMKREDRAPDTMATNFLDAARAVNHNFFLAFNPGYTMTQVAQLQINLWPELVKGGASWRDAQRAIMSSSSPAFKIMTAVLADAQSRGFTKHGADATLSAEILDGIQMSPDPTVDAEMKTFVMAIYNRGQQDLGSASREIGRRAEGRENTAFDTTMKWASSYNYHLEVLTRNMSALSAYQIGKRKNLSGDQLLDYASDVVRESMLNYREDNRARAFGRSGILGPFTPLSTAFLTFQHHITEKYVREWGALIRRTASPQEKAAARRWLVSHYSAMTAIAGTLGLPFVTIAARVLSGIGEWWQDTEEPIDVRVGWRNFLSDTFGQQVGEVLARGLPRAAGFDISSRVGTADFFPFSRLLTDRRDWEDALKDFADRVTGAPVSMVTGIVSGGQKIAQGRIMDGMREALPMALRNPMEAVRMTREGMLDRRGNLLPVEPEVMDIVWQAVGLSPARRAEYTEANFSQAVRRGVTGRRATQIRREVVRAVQTGDRKAVSDSIENAREFDTRVSPQFRVMPTMAQAIRQAVMARERAMAMGQPLRVAATDLVGREQTRFANFR